MRRKITLARLFGYLVMMALLVLAGCRTSLPVAPSGQRSTGPRSEQASGADQTAYLVIRVRWPERDWPNFHAAAIPQSTNALRVTVTGADRAPLVKYLARQAGPATAPVTETLRLPEGANLAIAVDAFREGIPVPDGADVIARGSVAGINAQAGERLVVPLTLTPTFAPAITGLSFNGSPILETVTINGSGFGTGSIPVKVTFNGIAVAAADLKRTSDTVMTAKVPALATTGPLIVEVDGIPGNADTIYWVMRNDPPTLTLTAQGNSDSINLRTGQMVPLTLEENISYLFAGGKTAADFPAYAASKPTLSYLSTMPSVGTIASASFSAAAVGSTVVKAKIGSVESNPLTIVVSSQLRITTVAGSGAASVVSSTLSAGLRQPYGLVIRANGALLVADQGNHRIRSINGTAVTVLAGDGSAGLVNAASDSARLRYPAGIARDAADNIYVADKNNHSVRKIAAGSGIVTTLVGNGIAGSSGDGRPAAEGLLNFPQGISISAAGDIVIADTLNHKIRIVAGASGTNRYGQNMVAGNLYTLAGQGPDAEGNGGFLDNSYGLAARFSSPTGVAVAVDGTVYVADSGNRRIRKIDPSGAVTTIAGTGAQGSTGDGGAASAAQFEKPTALVVDSAGTIFVADRLGKRIRSFLPGGNISTVAGTGVAGIQGDGGPATSAQLSEPVGLALTADALFMADFGSDRIRKLFLTGELAGQIATVAENAGTGGLATATSLASPQGVTAFATGFYVADTGNHLVRQVNAAGTLATLAGIGTAGFAGDGGDPKLARLDRPVYLRQDAPGNLYIVDQGNRRIRVIAAETSTLFGVAVSSGSIYTVAGGGTGTFAEGSAAAGNVLLKPAGIAFTTDGDLLIADSAAHTVRKIARNSGIITTFAGNGTGDYGGDGSAASAAWLNAPRAIAVQGDGSVLICDSLNHRIRQVSLQGIITTVAGGGTELAYGENVKATSAQLNVPADIFPDGNGGFYFTDSANHTVRQVTAAGTIFTIAGMAKTVGFLGDDGSALSARLDTPVGIARDALGNLLIADAGNHRIRKLAAD
ncbi:MAG: IPT/TIG domain-containing protein [Cyanobacteria bacterium NC_groundwater_1444_Ag_S-0.65um_54_12]|nr:IPT/TIG domain-containing protein [Cyanobacteria bacterium NC_groundwater_1444_Ag_S-0.65um_54_12]